MNFELSAKIDTMIKNKIEFFENQKDNELKYKRKRVDAIIDDLRQIQALKHYKDSNIKKNL